VLRAPVVPDRTFRGRPPTAKTPHRALDLETRAGRRRRAERPHFVAEARLRAPRRTLAADRLEAGSLFVDDPAWHEPVTPPSPPNRNRRASPRKAIRRSARVLVGDVARDVQTWDLGRDGMCLISTRPIAPGTRCRIVFELPLGGESVAVSAAARVVYSSYSAAGEFKIGALFLDLDDDAAAALGTFAAGA
jgi:hypothetical protein